MGDAATRDSGPSPLLEVRNLIVEFPAQRGFLRRAAAPFRAVNDVSFTIAPGETFGLVGESGSGKSTVGRAVLRLVRASAGTVLFEGQNILALNLQKLRALRRRMQIVFQDPVGSLNPRLRVGTIVGEPLLVHGLARGNALRERVHDLLVRCGLEPDAASRYPHQFSGGQRQRIGIARAIALEPALIICDEPTSALDVSIQAQILNLLRDLQRERGTAYLFISHDMAVIDHMCDRIAVMREGRIVEQGPRSQLISSPAHAYTRRLLAAVPRAPIVAA